MKEPKRSHGYLLEYSNVENPLKLGFEFNPSSISRTRSVNVQTGEAPSNRGGYSFKDKTDAHRASSGVTMDPETFSITILLDSTDRMNDFDFIDSIIAKGTLPNRETIMKGIQPEIDILRSMVEPKVISTEGARILASLNSQEQTAILSQEYASVIIFGWGERTLPVFLTSVQIDEKAHLPNLAPYRAEATIQMQVIESNNKPYKAEVERQYLNATTFGHRITVPDFKAGSAQ